MTFRSKYIPAEINEMTMATIAGPPDPDLVRGAFRGGVQTHGAHRRRLARQPAQPRRSGSHHQPAAVERPEPEFTIRCARTGTAGPRRLRERVAAYAAVGVQHVMLTVNRDVDDWDAVIEGAGRP